MRGRAVCRGPAAAAAAAAKVNDDCKDGGTSDQLLCLNAAQCSTVVN